MCYYNRLIVPETRVFSIADMTLSLPDQSALTYAIQSGFEYGSWPIVRAAAAGGLEIVQAHWEFLAPWVKSWKEVEAARQKYTTLNAVGENMLSSNLYKEAAMKRRCLVPSSGFYEWRHVKLEGAKKETAVPYFVYLPGQPVFYMAGIWGNWTDRETGEHLVSFAIVTTAANELMSKVHNKKKRMPLILPDELALEWMQPGLSEARVKELTHYQLDPALMDAYTIQKDFRQALNPVERVEVEGLPAL
jgi:putative SOS response-associated peptidase YedK